MFTLAVHLRMLLIFDFHNFKILFILFCTVDCVNCKVSSSNNVYKGAHCPKAIHPAVIVINFNDINCLLSTLQLRVILLESFEKKTTIYNKK